MLDTCGDRNTLHRIKWGGEKVHGNGSLDPTSPFSKNDVLVFETPCVSLGLFCCLCVSRRQAEGVDPGVCVGHKDQEKKPAITSCTMHLLEGCEERPPGSG